MSQSFQAKKEHILASLSREDSSYTDASPKGSVDEYIRLLVSEINRADGFVTTSSCSGRVALFVEGLRKPKTDESRDLQKTNDRHESSVSASAGGKGSGRWLFTSHQPVILTGLEHAGALVEHLGLSSDDSTPSFPASAEQTQFIHFKFEPMILHILCSTPTQAQLALNAALSAGFRESGISSLHDSRGNPSNPMVAVRTSGLALDSIVGFVSPSIEGPSRTRIMVSEAYLRTLVQVANERFKVNAQRTERFRQALLEHIDGLTEGSAGGSGVGGKLYEPSDVRKERKRREGLRRRDILLAEKNGEISESMQHGNFPADVDLEHMGYDLHSLELDGHDSYAEVR